MSHTKHLTKMLVVTGIVSMVFGAFGGFLGSQFLDGGRAGLSRTTKIIEQKRLIEESEVISAIEEVTPAVISIIATRDLPVLFQNTTRSQRVGSGSGFIVQEDGLAFTNNHVVLDSNASYTAVTKNGAEYDVVVIDKDPSVDFAVVQLYEKGTKKKPSGLSVAKLGSSGDLRVGQKVLAIGYALAQYDNTVTQGIVSAVGREIVAGGGGFSEQLTGLIQTDAAINPGNSGGPLINLAGEVIGVNTAIDRSGNGIGFAVPVDDIVPGFESVKLHGRIIRPMLGVRHMILNDARAKELKIAISHGALVLGDETSGVSGVVPGSAAAKAGVRDRDVITAIDGSKITMDHTLAQAIRGKSVGDTLILSIWRNGEELQLTAELQERAN